MKKLLKQVCLTRWMHDNRIIPSPLPGQESTVKKEYVGTPKTRRNATLYSRILENTCSSSSSFIPTKLPNFIKPNEFCMVHVHANDPLRSREECTVLNKNIVCICEELNANTKCSTPINKNNGTFFFNSKYHKKMCISTREGTGSNQDADIADYNNFYSCSPTNPPDHAGRTPDTTTPESRRKKRLEGRRRINNIWCTSDNKNKKYLSQPEIHDFFQKSQENDTGYVTKSQGYLCSTLAVATLKEDNICDVEYVTTPIPSTVSTAQNLGEDYQPCYTCTELLHSEGTRSCDDNLTTRGPVCTGNTANTDVPESDINIANRLYSEATVSSHHQKTPPRIRVEGENESNTRGPPCDFCSEKQNLGDCNNPFVYDTEDTVVFGGARMNKRQQVANLMSTFKYLSCFNLHGL